MDTLPAGTNMIATGVVTPFFVPVKVTMMVAFVFALPWVLYQAWAFIAPGPVCAREAPGPAAGARQHAAFPPRHGVLLLLRVRHGVQVHRRIRAEGIVPAPDIEQYLSFVMSMFIAFGITFEVPVAVILMVKAGIVDVAKLRESRPT